MKDELYQDLMIVGYLFTVIILSGWLIAKTVVIKNYDYELIKAKSLAVEFYEESENHRLAVNSLNAYLEELEANIPLLKDLL